MHVKFGALTIGLAVCLATGVSHGASAVSWQPTLERAQVVAAHSNRLVLVHFWGNGCPPCAWMDREVFTRRDVASAIDHGFVAVKINKDQFPRVASQLGVAAVPTDVFMTPQGQVLGSYVGKAPAAEFVNRLSQIAQRVSPSPGPQYPVQARGQVAPPNAYAQGYGQQNPAQQPQPTAGYPGGSGANQSLSPHTQQTMPSGYALPAQVTPRYSDQYGTGPNAATGLPTTPPAIQPGMNGAQGVVPGAGSQPMATSSYSPNSPMAPANTMLQQSGQLPQSPSARQAATAPAETNPPFALDGCCPVSLEKAMRLDPQPKWVPGDPRWGLRHEGRTYLFAGPEEQQVFFSDPNFYAPVLSGSDVVLQVEQGQQVPGAREFGARWRDRVYLFSSRENYDKFRENPTFYENELFGAQAAAVGTAQQSGQRAVGAAMNGRYSYR